MVITWVITTVFRNIIIMKNNMTENKNINTLLLATIIISVALATITVRFITFRSHANNIDFSCTSEIESLIDIDEKQWIFNGITTLTSFQEDKMSLSVKGKLTFGTEEDIVNRRLLFSYTVPANRNKGAFISRFIGHEKKPDDNSPDKFDYIFFDAYRDFDKINIIKRIDERTVIVGDNFSPVFACVINNID